MYWINRTLLLLLTLIGLVACSASGASTEAEPASPSSDIAEVETTEETTIERPSLAGQDLFQNIRTEDASLSSAIQTEEIEVTFSENVSIGIISIAAKHPVLAQSLTSLKTALQQAGYIEGENLTLIEMDAQGDIDKLNQMAQELVDANVDLIIANSTPASVAVYSILSEMETPIPLLFSSITNPYAAGLATAADDHVPWASGTQVFPPLLRTLETIRGLLPDASTVGIIYNPNEANSVAQLDELMELAPLYNFTIVSAEADDASKTGAAAQSLAEQNVDVLQIFQDSTVSLGADAIVTVANEEKIPLFVNVDSIVEQGAAVGLGLSFAEDGRLVGNMAVQFLKGTAKLSEMDIERVQVSNLFINREAAAQQGLDLPESFTSDAIEVITKVEAIEAAVEEVTDDENEAVAEDDGANFTIGITYFKTIGIVDEMQVELKKTLAEAGYVEGDNLTIIERNGDGDFDLIATHIQEFIDAEVDLIVAATTPSLQATYDAVSQMEDPIPVVFHAVTSPYAIGVAESADIHPNWLIGSQFYPPILTTFETISSILPDATQIGVLYNPDEANSVAQVDEMMAIAPS